MAIFPKAQTIARKIGSFFKSGVNPPYTGTESKGARLAKGLGFSAQVALAVASPVKWLKAAATIPIVYTTIKNYAQTGKFNPMPTLKENIYTAGLTNPYTRQATAGGILVGEGAGFAKDVYNVVAPIAVSTAEKVYDYATMPAKTGSKFDYEWQRQLALGYAHGEAEAEEAYRRAGELTGQAYGAVSEYVGGISFPSLPTLPVQVSGIPDFPSFGGGGELKAMAAALGISVAALAAYLGIRALRKKRNKYKRGKRKK